MAHEDPLPTSETNTLENRKRRRRAQVILWTLTGDPRALLAMHRFAEIAEVTEEERDELAQLHERLTAITDDEEREMLIKSTFRSLRGGS